MSREEMERLIFFESAREKAEADWKKNKKDTVALTRWGGALLELAHFRTGSEAVDLIQMAVEKLEMAIELNPRKHDALWCLGNALTSQGFLYADAEKANSYFESAKSSFQRAVAEEPQNESYVKALEMSQRAPLLHAELQRQLQEQQQQQQLAQQLAAQGGGAAQAEAKSDSDFYYDVAGWVCLLGLGTLWVALARNASK
eukprot:CAMPEP_0118931378 /NCGR_PEP_ID=MMETSP1169-20130426/7741_1 /TAXON_ID=36882 /ORGANISM="Pyramimonas obovata, Strain CCMP722" /LENGTH=199 /DNA_ID=CAMNT_0006873873 /DNA_START=31 /DNA_END=630 /DNA_ORIENTATION=-